MILWTTRFQTVRPVPAFPQLNTICSETIFSPAYHHRGKERQNDRHCIFKYTLEGEGCFRDAGGEYRVGPGSGFLVEIRDAETSYRYPEGGKEPWTFVWIGFSGDDAARLVRDLVRMYGAVYHLPEEERAIRRLLEFRREDGKAVTVTPARGASVVLDLLMTLARSKEKEQESDPVPVLVRRMQEAVESRIRENVNVSQVARQLGVSREYLTRRFKEEMAMTPHEYIVREKMVVACHLLKETAMSSKEVAAYLGYNVPAHFTRTFKRLLHMPPTRFRTVGTIPVW